MADEIININLKHDNIKEFNNKMYDLFYSTRPAYDECLLRCQVLNLFNEMWQNHLIEKEQNAMINKSNPHYASIITEKTFIETKCRQNTPLQPYRKYDTASTVSSTKPDPDDKNNDAANYWCTPIVGQEKEIIVREYENGPIIKRIIVPAVMIFGSIAFGLDGIGSDMDCALPASIKKPAVDAHLDSTLQQKLLRQFMQRLKLNNGKCKALGLRWKIEPILHARVPIIKLTELSKTKGKLSVDIGIRSTQMPITKLIRYYVNYEERVPVLYTFIKRWSKTRQISDAMHGFPNSFGFVMLVTKYLQLLQEPIIPIIDYNRKKDEVHVVHSIDRFKLNTMTCLELAASFFDYFAHFDFEAYQIDICSAGLQWKHPNDYNLNHLDQETMLIEDPSSKNENVTRCLKPHNLKIMKQEFFRAYKCAVHGNWDLLMKPYQEQDEENIFKIYPPINEFEEELRYEFEGSDAEEQYDDDEDDDDTESEYDEDDGDDGYNQYEDDGYFNGGYNKQNNHNYSGSEGKRQHFVSYAPISVDNNNQNQKKKEYEQYEQIQHQKKNNYMNNMKKQNNYYYQSKQSGKAAKINNYKKYNKKKQNFYTNYHQ